MTSYKPEVLLWFRQDLRIIDNPALNAALTNGVVLPIYIVDNNDAQDWQIGAASKVWLHYALQSLNQTLNNRLQFFIGDPCEIIAALTHRYNVKQVFWNRLYAPWQVARDKKIKAQLKAQAIEVHSFNSSLLWEPWEVLKSNGEPYKIFSSFKRQALQVMPPRAPLDGGKEIHNCLTEVNVSNSNLADLNLLPQHHWAKDVLDNWQISEKAAHHYLDSFIEHSLNDYQNNRNIPSLSATSKLAPFLHFGQISPHIIWDKLHQTECDNKQSYLSEIIWREFNYALLYHYPQLSDHNWQQKFDHYPWQDDQALLIAWQQGQTGVPIVDAGMRELWQTGFMHNRVRMIVASFLTKNCHIHWRHGAKWFWDYLFDADLANNSANWQWVAGSGADAAPFFRIFNPVTQGQKFDGDGEYIRRYLPELSQLPNKYLFSPWLAPESVLKQAGITLGEDYPYPVVDLKVSREEALAYYKNL
ncbi:cryptochrome/photolyase family protein [Cysteiniphilum halobium]|uniref:cryptochrome/photolyase family protein n=1 Tax=Cysteiniphilum halobium TaxID=2219059 RepID=UPI000E64ECBA|nr:deoxyribodipyrimidine photo-lyase [Cysteiniphilum halobium]